MNRPDDIAEWAWDAALYNKCWDCEAKMLGQGAVCETCRGSGRLAPSTGSIARALMAAEARGREWATQLIETHSESNGPDGKTLRPRHEGDQSGLAYVAEIRRGPEGLDDDPT